MEADRVAGIRLLQEALADALTDAAEALERPYDPTVASNLSIEYRKTLIDRLVAYAGVLHMEADEEGE